MRVLETHKHIYDLYERTNELVNFGYNIQEEVVNAYKVFHPHYHYNHGCHVCVCEMIHTVYSWYKKQRQ